VFLFFAHYNFSAFLEGGARTAGGDANKEKG